MMPSPSPISRPCSSRRLGFRKRMRLPEGSARSLRCQRSSWRASNVGARPASTTGGMEDAGSPPSTRTASCAATCPDTSMLTSSPPMMPAPRSSEMNPKTGRRLAAETRASGSVVSKSRPDASWSRLPQTTSSESVSCLTRASSCSSVRSLVKISSTREAKEENRAFPCSAWPRS